EFQKKCLGKMEDAAKGGRTILFVSHNMAAIRSLCQRTMLIDKGKLLMDSTTDETVAHYLDQNLLEGAIASDEQIESRMEGQINRGNPSVRFRRIALLDRNGVARNSFDSNEDIIVSITFECLKAVRNLHVLVSVVDENNFPILSTQNVDDPNITENFYQMSPGFYNSTCILPKNTFGGRNFFLTACLISPKTEHVTVKKILEFEVKFQGYNNFYGGSGDVFFRPQLKWVMRSVDERELSIHRR
ncbi:MAG: Wzt carbohydrate-binding domain-containing protein, partial [Sedimentisphaerales bacterium]|nr:Wzt carbohydrate-binding domain-containing protein [Sedimentisphaerales bacterium]